jgi:hypothetical protein
VNKCTADINIYLGAFNDSDLTAVPKDRKTRFPLFWSRFFLLAGNVSFYPEIFIGLWGDIAET